MDTQSKLWRRSRLRALLQPCLSRNAAERPSAEHLLELLERVGHATTGTS